MSISMSVTPVWSRSHFTKSSFLLSFSLHPSLFLPPPFDLPPQGAEARQGARRSLARPGGASGPPDADAHRGGQEPAQPPGARRERGPTDPFDPADVSLRPARAQAQRGLLFLLWRRGERHLGAAPQRLDSTGVRGQGEDMRLMVKVLGEKRYKTQPLFFFYLVSSRAWLLVKKRTNSVIRGKRSTFFFPTDLCETGSFFAVHTLCCRSEDEYGPKV